MADESQLSAHLTIEDLCNRYKCSRVTLWSWRRAGLLPRPLQIGVRALRWRLPEIQAWERAGCPAVPPGPAAGMAADVDEAIDGQERIAQLLETAEPAEGGDK